MMFRNQSGRYAWMKALYLIPLAGIALAAFAKPNVMETIETKVSDEMDSFPTPFAAASRNGADTPSSDDNDWAQDPRGIYRLTKITGRNGIEMDAPFDQYKICEEDATFSFWVNGSNSKDVQFRLNINDANVFDYTGRVPQEEDGHGSQIYDSNGKEFKLRWWSVYKDHALFPDHGWVVEKYERDKFSKPAEEILSMLRDTKEFDSNDPYAGIWWMSEKNEAELQAWKDGKGSFETLLSMTGMVVRGHRVLRFSFVNDINMARRGYTGSVQDCSHKRKEKIRIGSRIYEPEWIGDNYFYYQTEKGNFQFWTRQTIGKEFLYDNLLSILHACLHQSHPLATSKFDTKPTRADISVSSSDSIYLAPNVSLARFEGGESALMHYMQSHLHYPDPIYRKYGFEGRLMVSFVVEKDGSLQHFSVIRNNINTKETALSLHVTEEEYETFINKRKAAFEDVVINILQSMPKWQPAIHETNGKKEYVRMKYTMPFTFRLQ